MPAPFLRITHQLDAEGARGWGPRVAAAGAMLIAFLAWATLARVSVYVTGPARLEVLEAAHPVDIPVQGRVVAVHLELGRAVDAGDVLVELDAVSELAVLDQAKAALPGIRAQLEGIGAELAGEQDALTLENRAGEIAVREAATRAGSAKKGAEFEAASARRVAGLFKAGSASAAELEQARASAASARSKAQELALAVERLETEHARGLRDRRTRIERLARGRAELAMQLESSEATVKRLEHEVALRRVSAPVAGRLGQVSELRVGGAVGAGTRVASVVPRGTLRITSELAAGDAVGRVQAGSAARLRLEGFPWTQYGTLPGVVQEVATEADQGRVRVELELGGDERPTFPLMHGLVGTIEIEVERVSPAVLALRGAGALADGAAR